MSGEAGPPSREGWWSPLPINSFLNPVPSRGIWAISMSHSVVVQLLSHVRLFAIPWTTAHQASLSFTVSWSLLKFMSVELVMPSNHLILCYPVLKGDTKITAKQSPSHPVIPCIRWHWEVARYTRDASGVLGPASSPVHVGSVASDSL